MILSTQTVLAIGLGGALGAIARAYTVHVSNKYIPLELPFGILLVNVIGSFIIGLLFAYFATVPTSDTTKAFLTTGFLGALTTYSTFAIESFFLLQTSLILGISNMLLNVVGTVLAASSGYKIIHFFLK
mgnify:CR=1 FL=1